MGGDYRCRFGLDPAVKITHIRRYAPHWMTSPRRHLQIRAAENHAQKMTRCALYTEFRHLANTLTTCLHLLRF